MKKTDIDNRFEYRDLYSGLIRLHILHHAVEGPIVGLEMAEELARHGYRISLGTLYPLLHGMEKKGYLLSAEMRKGQALRKVYRATPLGRKALKAMCMAGPWICGGYWYVHFYPAEKTLIPNGPWPFAHNLFMETREHFFSSPGFWLF